MNEFKRISELFKPLTNQAPEAAGLLDDAAFLTSKQDEIWVISTDAISEGIHYVGDESPDLIARKLLRTNLSDLAAKGAIPKFYTLNIMLPTYVNDAWLEAFAQGLALDQQHYGLSLIGGDSITVKGNFASFSATIFGVVPNSQQPLMRSGARVNDLICISGTLGDASVYLKRDAYDFTAADIAYLKERYTLPEPQLKLGHGLLGLASSCMDISDGLAQDIGHIAHASGVGVFISAVDIKLSTPLKSVIARQQSTQYSLMETALTGGDDYELLFTIAEHDFDKAQAMAHGYGVEISPIGRVVAEDEIKIIGLDGMVMQIDRPGYSH